MDTHVSSDRDPLSVSAQASSVAQPEKAKAAEAQREVTVSVKDKTLHVKVFGNIPNKERIQALVPQLMEHNQELRELLEKGELLHVENGQISIAHIKITPEQGSEISRICQEIIRHANEG